MTPGNQAEMPFLDHLEELRWRVLWSLVALVIGVGISFWLLLQFDVIWWLQQPIAPYLGGQKLVYTHPIGPFKITMSAAFGIGFILALPVIAYQLWSFLAPALYQHEKRVVIPVFAFGAVLFFMGASLAYKGIIPLTLRMVSGMQTESLTPMISATEYFDFVISFCLVMGIVFELPIVVLALTALGVVTPQFLGRFRRHAAVLCLVGSAFITPGQDPFSLMAVALPLYGLYEVSVIASYMVWRRKQRRLAAEAEADRYGAPA